MELLLNLAWLLLALPAWWLWRSTDRRSSSPRCWLILGCALVLLFPVVSATDDLHTMRPDIEESSPNKRALRHGGGEKLSLQHTFGTPPAQLFSFQFAFPFDQFWGNQCRPQDAVFTPATLKVPSGRAPPVA